MDFLTLTLAVAVGVLLAILGLVALYVLVIAVIAAVGALQQARWERYWKRRFTFRD